MGSFAQTTTELLRLSGIPGIIAIRDPRTARPAASGVDDNRVLIKDGRTSSRRVPDSTSIEGVPQHSVNGRWGYIVFNVKAADAGALFDSDLYIGLT